MENGYNFDFLTVSFKDVTYNDILGILCDSFPQDFVPQNFIGHPVGGLPGYNTSLRFMDEKYITISWYEEREKKLEKDQITTVCLNITGKGFSYLVPDDLFTFFQNLKKCEIKYNVTRLDVCYDDFTGKIPKEKFLEEFKKFRLGENNIATYISRDSVKTFTGSFNRKDYENLVVGSRQSEKMLRIYDKKAEQKNKEVEYWERIEIQLRQRSARQFLEYILETKNFGQGFADTLLSMFRFVEFGKDTNKSRNKTQEWYDKYLEFMISEKVYI